MDEQPDPEPASDDEFTRDVKAGLGGTAVASGSDQEPENDGPGEEHMSSIVLLRKTLSI